MKKRKKLKNSFKSLIGNLNLINFIVITAAGIISAIGVTMFLAPVHLYDSGISGTSMLLWQITPEYLTLSMFLIILNVPLFLYGLKKQGAVFTVYSIYAVLVYSISSHLITYVLPVDVSFASPLAEQDLFLCAIFGGIIAGTGSGLALRFDAAVDGIEVLAVIFAKKIGITVGTFIMGYNIILYVIIGIALGSWILPLYSIITYVAALKTIDFIVEGIDKAKAALIITTKAEEICSELSEQFGSGITLIDAHGYYSSSPKQVIYFVVNRFQIGKLRRIVHKNDKSAFISISETADVFGSNTKTY